MSSKNIKRWITINGNHVPVYEDGTLGGVAEKFTSYDGKEHEFHAEKAAGKTVEDLKDDLKKNYGLEIDSADADDMERSKSFNDEKVIMYDEDGNEYEGTYNTYSDGGREIVDIKKKGDKIEGNWAISKDEGDEHDRELTKVMDKIENDGSATTSNKEVASQYKLNKNFDVEETDDGYKISRKTDKYANMSDEQLIETAKNTLASGNAEATFALSQEAARRGWKSLNGPEKSAKESFKEVPDGHKITVKDGRGDEYEMTSYGEGWKDDYHVAHTDKYGGEFIDGGKVGDYEIGEKVNYLSGDKMKSGTITKAHIYPNGKVDYNVVDSDGDGHNVSSNNLAKTDENRSKSIKVGDKEVTVSPSKESAKITKGVENARRQLDFDRPGEYAEISDRHWGKTLGVSNDRMAEMMSVQDPKYDYEYRKDTEPGNMWTGGAEVEHHRMYRVPKGNSGITMSTSQIQAMIKNIRSGKGDSQYTIAELQEELRRRKKG